MIDNFFIDSNILIYAHDSSEKEKQDISKKLIFDGISNDNMVLSAQVLNEFFVITTKKIKKTLPVKIAGREIELLRTLTIVDIDIDLILQAIDLSQKHKLSYWDSLIISAAKRSNCTIIYTEDLNSGQKIESISIINPFI